MTSAEHKIHFSTIEEQLESKNVVRCSLKTLGNTPYLVELNFTHFLGYVQMA